MCNIVQYRAKIEERWSFACARLIACFMPTLAYKTGGTVCVVSVSSLGVLKSYAMSVIRYVSQCFCYICYFEYLD